jgi:hypothetical protein
VQQWILAAECGLWTSIRRHYNPSVWGVSACNSPWICALLVSMHEGPSSRSESVA